MHDTTQAHGSPPALSGLLELMLLAAFPDGLPAGMDRAAVLASMAERLAAMRPELGARLNTDEPEVDAETLERAQEIRQVLEARVREALGTAPAEPARSAPADPIGAAPSPVVAAAAAPAPREHEPAAPGELTAGDKLRMLRAYADERRSRLMRRSDLVRPRRQGAEPTDEDAPADTSGLSLDERAAAIGRARLRID